MVSKPISSTNLWPTHQLLPPGSCPVSISALASFSGFSLVYVSQINPLILKLILVRAFIIAMVALTKTTHERKLILLLLAAIKCKLLVRLCAGILSDWRFCKSNALCYSSISLYVQLTCCVW